MDIILSGICFCIQINNFKVCFCICFIFNAEIFISYKFSLFFFLPLLTVSTTCQVVYSYIFTLLSCICLSLVIICVLLLLWVYYVNLRLCKSYVFLLRNYFPQMSSHTLIYVEYFLIMAIKKHLLAHNL